MCEQEMCIEKMVKGKLARYENNTELKVYAFLELGMYILVEKKKLLKYYIFIKKKFLICRNW